METASIYVRGKHAMQRSHEQVVWDFVQGWLAQARQDLRSAEALVAAGLEDYTTAGFHARQAAEAYLKAVLNRHRAVFPVTSDLRQLLECLRPLDPRLASDLSDATLLTPFVAEQHSPGQAPLSREIAERAVAVARSVRQRALEHLREYLADGRPKE